MPTPEGEYQVTAIVVTYQSARTVSETLAALRESHDLRLLQCVVVDNGSRDDTPKILEHEARWARIVLEHDNHGFGRGCNIGIAYVATPYTLLLNPDAVVGGDAVRKMAAFLEANPEVGVVGPSTTVGTKTDSAYQHTGPLPRPLGILQELTRLFGQPVKPRTILPGSSPFRTGWVCGAVLMIRTDLLRRLGGFDPAFFLYWEEMDLCHRVEDAGYEIWAVGEAVAHHLVGASSSASDVRTHGCIARHYYQSRRHYLIKHHGWMVATLTELAEFLLLLLLTGFDVVRGRGIKRIRPRLQAALLSRPSAVR